jgi:Eukaryotic cytochrome b561/DOMON domain
MMKILFLFLLALLSCCCCCSRATETNQFKDGFQIGFNVDGDMARFDIQMTTVAWLGIGWHCANQTGICSQPGMTAADFVVATFFDNGTLRAVEDRVANGADVGRPPLDVERSGCADNIVSFSGFQTQKPAVTQFSFTRKLRTGDACDWDLVTSLPMRFIYAYGQSNAFGYHGPNNRGAAIINMGTGLADEESSKMQNMRIYHALAMAIGFAGLMPFAIFVARYVKPIGWIWFPLHWGSLALALCFIAAGLGLAIAFVQDTTGSHFVSAHAIVGLITVCLTALTVLLGVMANYMWDPERKAAPWFPDRLHHWSGRIAWLLSGAAVVLGSIHLGLNEAVPYMLGALYILIVGMFVCIEAALFVQRRFGVLAPEGFEDDEDFGQKSVNETTVLIDAKHSTRLGSYSEIES